MSIRIPGIPGTQNLSPEQRRVIEPMKQALEILLQTRGDQAGELIDGDRLKRKTVAQEQLGDNSVRDRNIPDGEIKAKHISVISLESLSAVLGTITSGRIQNAGNTNYIDFNATGNAIALKFGGGLEIEADGDARFGGILTASGVVTNENLGGSVVSTSKVAANAITANVESNLSSAVTLTGSQQDIVTVTITTTGGPVIILASTNSQLNSSGVAGGNPNNRLYVYRDSTLIAPVDGVTNFAHAFSNAPASISVYTQMTFIVHDEPTAGTYTYKLRARTDVTGQASNVFHSTIIVAEFKR